MNTNVVSFIVVKPIKVGEEITTFYSGNYFGLNNQECLCLTCEKYLLHLLINRFQRNGFGEAPNFNELGLNSNLVGLVTHKRIAKQPNFNYYDIPNFNEDSKAKKKKEREEAARVSSCFICLAPHADMGSSSGNDTPFDPCVRCFRHLMIFNMPFPQRKLLKNNVEEESFHEIYVVYLT